MSDFFRRHNEGADVAAALLEAAYGGYRAEIQGGAPCIDARLKSAIFAYASEERPSGLEQFYGLFVLLSHNPGFARAKANGLVRCSDYRYEARGWRPAASEPLLDACRVPHAWTARGLRKSELCLDIQVYALVLEMWAVNGGEAANEDAFVHLVRYLSAQARPSTTGIVGPPECQR
jgi:hypothetical protein